MERRLLLLLALLAASASALPKQRGPKPRGPEGGKDGRDCDEDEQKEINLEFSDCLGRQTQAHHDAAADADTDEKRAVS